MLPEGRKLKKKNKGRKCRMNRQGRREQKRTWEGRTWRPWATAQSETPPRTRMPSAVRTLRATLSLPFYNSIHPPLGLYVHSHSTHFSMWGLDQ